MMGVVRAWQCPACKRQWSVETISHGYALPNRDYEKCSGVPVSVFVVPASETRQLALTSFDDTYKGQVGLGFDVYPEDWDGPEYGTTYGVFALPEIAREALGGGS